MSFDNIMVLIGIHLKRTCTYDIFIHDYVSIIYNLY